MDDDHEANEDLPMHREAEDVQDDHSAHKLACDRCRRRKIRCDRLDQCSQCTRTKALCTYPPGLKPREKRQRIHISTVYEQKIDQIVQKLGELDYKLGQLSQDNSARPQAPGFHGSAEVCPAAKSPISASPADTNTSESRARGQNDSPGTEYEGESSLTAHASFATGHLQNIVNSSPLDATSLELTSIIGVLRDVVDAQREEIDTLAILYPLAKALPPGSTFRSLPMPPIEIALACLRMVKEHPQIKWLWFFEFHQLHQFTEYLLKLYSPGKASDADFIIVNAGLYWLFEECAGVIEDQQTKTQYEHQASLCRSNLETILSRLPFHYPTTIDYACAMSMASTYCLLNGKPSAAWNFIASASRLCLSLGLHSAHTLSMDAPECRQQKWKLFWAIYNMERNLSLRLGRSSCIRDNEVTLPKAIPTMTMGQSTKPILAPVWPYWIELASLQGRIYDEIYSPGALLQPSHVRTSHARDLASELKIIMQRAENFEAHENKARRRALGPDMHAFLLSSDKVFFLSLLALVYRAIPAEKPARSGVCIEAVTTARDALAEHTNCLSIIFAKYLDTRHLETYINWSLLQSPFIPVVILFCHVVETSDAADLKSLNTLVDSLQLTSPAFKKTYAKQLSLFKTLFDVAQKFVEVKAKDTSQHSLSPNFESPRGSMGPVFQPPQATSEFPALLSVSMTPDSRLGPHTGTTGIEPTSDQHFGQIPPNGQNNDYAVQLQDRFCQPMDPQGTELGDWFHGYHQMYRLLEEGYP
ncbi:hypothetical protein F4779DRAFT_256397 [Xylariaceae sp. FL0662B]|nr:hypothetical protein F4779DRAFT_256397 [Xylariaceae sp. FL0662B]